MRHIPVLLQEVIENLALRPGLRIVDGTLGDAGHAEEILRRITPGGRLLGLDADHEAIARSKQFLSAYQDAITLVQTNFSQLEAVVTQEQFAPVNGILLDLGWSTPQFEERGRGFSFLLPSEPLDMRFSDMGDTETAAQILNNRSETELFEIFSTLGEEKLSREIAQSIVKMREQKPFTTVADLVGVVLSTYRTKLKTDREIPWVGGLHPATKVFQALRIAVNHELEVLESVLEQALRVLAPQGRLLVITFHSLEDRIVKHFFKSQNNIKIITKKPIVCADAEYELNPRARSAKLRVVEKL